MQKKKYVVVSILTFAFQLLFVMVVMPCRITLFDRLFLQYHRTKGGVPIFAFSCHFALPPLIPSNRAGEIPIIFKLPLKTFLNGPPVLG